MQRILWDLIINKPQTDIVNQMNITHCHLKALSVDLLATIVVSCTKKKE